MLQALRESEVPSFAQQDEFGTSTDRHSGVSRRRWFSLGDSASPLVVRLDLDRPFDFVSEAKLFVSGESHLGQEGAEQIDRELRELMLRLGRRKLLLRATMLPASQRWFAALSTVVPPEGCFREYVFREGSLFDEVVLGLHARRMDRLGGYSPSEPLYRTAASVLEMPWESWRMPEQFALDPWRLVMAQQVDPSQIQTLELRAFERSAVDHSATTVLAPAMGPASERPDLDFIVLRDAHPTPVARISLSDLDCDALHCALRVVVDPAHENRGLAFIASALGLSEAFSRYPLRKVYFDLTTPASQQLARTAVRFCALEAHLLDDYLVRSRPFDRFVFSVDRAGLARYVAFANSSTQLSEGT